MSLTKPCLAYPVIVAETQTIQIDYTSPASPASEEVTIAAGTYYLQGDGGADDLWQVLEDALNTSAQHGGLTWQVVHHNEGTVSTDTGQTLIKATGGSATVDSFQFITQTELSARTFGFALSDATTTVTFVVSGSSTATGVYQCPSLFLPHTETYTERYTYKDAAVVQGNDAGDGDLDFYQGRKEWHIQIPEVHEVLIREQYNATAAMVARVPSLTSGDTHCSLDSWLRRMHSARSGASLPALRWTSDLGSLGTYIPVWVGDPRLYASVEAWTEGENVGGIPWMDLNFRLVEDV